MTAWTAGAADSRRGAKVIPLARARHGAAAASLAALQDSDELRAIADAMWPAWRTLTTWEERAAEEFGSLLGRLLLLLWAVHRFAGVDQALVVCEELVDLGAYDPLLADIAELAFALGAAWGAECVPEPAAESSRQSQITAVRPGFNELLGCGKTRASAEPLRTRG